MTMSMPLLPDWMSFAWAAVLAGVLAVHAWHAWSMRAQCRWWHLGHTAMAAGMLAMYLDPDMANPVLHRVDPVVFALVAVAEAGAAVVFRRREGVLNPLWASAAVDGLIMAYMLVFPMDGPVLVTCVLVAYLAVQVVAWAFGLWGRAPALRSAVAAGTAPGTARSVAGVGLLADSAPSVRASLAAMAAGMAYMLLAGVV